MGRYIPVLNGMSSGICFCIMVDAVRDGSALWAVIYTSLVCMFAGLAVIATPSHSNREGDSK